MQRIVDTDFVFCLLPEIEQRTGFWSKKFDRPRLNYLDDTSFPSNIDISLLPSKFVCESVQYQCQKLLTFKSNDNNAIFVIAVVYVSRNSGGSAQRAQNFEPFLVSVKINTSEFENYRMNHRSNSGSSNPNLYLRPEISSSKEIFSKKKLKNMPISDADQWELFEEETNTKGFLILIRYRHVESETKIDLLKIEICDDSSIKICEIISPQTSNDGLLSSLNLNGNLFAPFIASQAVHFFSRDFKQLISVPITKNYNSYKLQTRMSSTNTLDCLPSPLQYCSNACTRRHYVIYYMSYFDKDTESKSESSIPATNIKTATKSTKKNTASPSSAQSIAGPSKNAHDLTSSSSLEPNNSFWVYNRENRKWNEFRIENHVLKDAIIILTKEDDVLLCGNCVESGCEQGCSRSISIRLHSLPAMNKESKVDPELKKKEESTVVRTDRSLATKSLSLMLKRDKDGAYCLPPDGKETLYVRPSGIQYKEEEYKFDEHDPKVILNGMNQNTFAATNTYGIKQAGYEAEEKYRLEFQKYNLGGILLHGFHTKHFREVLQAINYNIDLTESPKSAEAPIRCYHVECDFIFIHEDYGVHFIEVKGMKKYQQKNKEDIKRVKDQIQRHLDNFPNLYQFVMEQTKITHEERSVFKGNVCFPHLSSVPSVIIEPIDPNWGIIDQNNAMGSVGRTWWRKRKIALSQEMKKKLRTFAAILAAYWPAVMGTNCLKSDQDFIQSLRNPIYWNKEQAFVLYTFKPINIVSDSTTKQGQTGKTSILLRKAGMALMNPERSQSCHVTFWLGNTGDFERVKQFIYRHSVFFTPGCEIFVEELGNSDFPRRAMNANEFIFYDDFTDLKSVLSSTSNYAKSFNEMVEKFCFEFQLTRDEFIRQKLSAQLITIKSGAIVQFANKKQPIWTELNTRYSQQAFP